jgi:hypothetical protein
LLSRRAARKHLVASRLPKYFLRPRSAGSVSPGSGRPVRRKLGYGPAVRLKPFRPHLAVGALSCALRSQPARHAPTARARQAAGAHPGGFPARRPSPAPLKPHLHPVLVLRSSCARRGITPAYWLRTPLGAGPTGLPPASNTASPARTTSRSASEPSRPVLNASGFRRWHAPSRALEGLRPRTTLSMLAFSRSVPEPQTRLTPPSRRAPPGQ